MPTQYTTLGFGISARAQIDAGIIPGDQASVDALNPLLLPVQLTSSNPPLPFNQPSTTPQDIYVRIPGTGQRFLQGLRFSIEYPRSLIEFGVAPPTPQPMVIGIWAGSIPDGYTPPVLSQTALTVTVNLFDPQALNSLFQSASNLNTIVPVQGGDYIALVVHLTVVGPLIPFRPYFEASVELI
jgi:hypothetical protein